MQGVPAVGQIFYSEPIFQPLAPIPVNRRKGRQRRVDHDLVRQLATEGKTDAEIAVRVGCTPFYVKQIRKGVTGNHDQKQSRFVARPLMGRATLGMPPIDNAAVMDGRSLFRNHVSAVARETVFKSGHNSSKIGKTITKGKWKGFEVYTLTLEERATCPKTCKHWRSCYGNNMQFAQRFAHGDALEEKIVCEIAAMARRHPRGFAIRLHTLGDFYSVRYVRLWEILLEDCPQLHIFGFSARWDYHGDPVARALIDLVRTKWDRFAIRFSNAPVDECSTTSIEHPYQKPADAVICPQQLGKTASCSTCALCWQSKRRVAFIQH